LQRRGAPNDERRRLKSGGRTAPVLSTSPPVARILNAAREGGV